MEKKNRKRTFRFYMMPLMEPEMLKIRGSTATGLNGPSVRPLERGTWQGFVGEPDARGEYLLETSFGNLVRRLAAAFNLDEEDARVVLHAALAKAHKKNEKCREIVKEVLEKGKDLLTELRLCETEVAINDIKKYIKEFLKVALDALGEKVDEEEIDDLLDEVLGELEDVAHHYGAEKVLVKGVEAIYVPMKPS